MTAEVFRHETGYVGIRQVLKDRVGIGNDGQPLKCFEQRNDITPMCPMSNSLASGTSVYLKT